MINDHKFEAGLDLLQRHFKKALDEDAIAIWREYLDDELDDEQFTTAVKESILKCEFFPPAVKLVEFATASMEVKAGMQWRIVLNAAATTSEDWQKEILSALSVRSRIALQIIGGIHAVGLADDWALRNLAKDFVAAHCQCSGDIKFLPPSLFPPKTFEVVETPRVDWCDLEIKSRPIRQVLEMLAKRTSGIEASDREKAFNMFSLKHKWEIDESRLDHYLAMDMPTKQHFLAKFSYAIRHSPSWKSASVHFDAISGYIAKPFSVDSKAIAASWLEGSDDD
ncbi:hypothetical protein [Nostoc sp.]|uniref:hypothetical protein n=1 Tax=Nostoc sp. TaxID=1180 RepID=UPI002FFB82BB